MKKGNKGVFGIFDTKVEVEEAVAKLRGAGFRNTDISVLMPQMGDTQTFAHEKSTKAPEGATIGAGTGLVLGGALGWLVGAGMIAATPALGPLVAAGPILAALVGVGVGGTVGGVAGALLGFGLPEYEAKRYESFIKKGGILLSVHVDNKDWLDKAQRILETAGAHDIANSNEVADRSRIKTSEPPTITPTY
ncbi:MAG: quinol:electron acceptor oxidoreductase subunit ActD [Bdellovibrionales bacterium]